MKTICSFCKTQFGGVGKCPICGHRARVLQKKSKTQKLWIAAALFLVASIFSVVALNVWSRNQKSELLTISISDVRNYKNGYIVRGNIRNFSENTYSIPDLIFVFKTSSGAVLTQVVQLPPSGLIEPMSDMEFIKKIEPLVVGAEKISVIFAGVEQ